MIYFNAVPVRALKLTVVFLFVLVQVHAQTIITGTFLGNTNESPTGVSVLLHSKNDKGQIISYAYSNNKGQFQLSCTSKQDSVAISTRSLNFRDTTIFLRNKNQDLKIRLQKQYTKIKEVNVRGVPIITKEDTTTYMVGAFKRNGNESIGDVINNMPGFQLQPDGRLSYMGKPIEKYYIEGMDLLEGRYTLANKNLSHDKVRSVEVLHNHQPIKMLRKEEFNDGTSVNIKLKNKYTTAYSIKGNIGIPVPLYGINFSPMVFSPKHQMIGSVQSNNLGYDLWSQFRPFSISDKEIDNYTNTKKDLVHIPSLVPSLLHNKERYFYNNSNLLSANCLSKIDEDKEIKVNIGYFNDWIKEKGLLNTSFYIENDTISITEQSKNRFGKNSLLTDIVYTDNAANRYVNNKFRVENYWDMAKSNINYSSVNQNSNLPFFSLANELDFHKKIGKHFISFNAFIDYDNSEQFMQFTPGVFSTIINNGNAYNKTVQHWHQNQLLSKVKGSFSLRLKKWVLGNEVGFSFKNSELSSFIENDMGYVNNNDLKNALHLNDGSLFFNERLSFQSQLLKLRFNFPVSFHSFVSNDKLHGNSHTINRIFFSPRFYGQYKFRRRWQISGNSSFSNTLGNFEGTTLGYSIKNYRTISKGHQIIPEFKTYNNGLSLQYQHAISGWFASASFNSYKKESNIILSKESIGDGIFSINGKRQKNASTSYNFKGDITYFKADWNTTLSVFPSYKKTRSNFLLNDFLDNYSSQQMSLRCLINLARWKIFRLKYNFRLTHLKQWATNFKTNIVEQEHIGDIYFQFSQKHWLDFRTEYVQSKNNHDITTAYFSDATYNYKPSKGKFKYSLKLRNLFNEESFVQFRHNEFSFIQNTFYIRPRELILSFSYRL